MASPTRLTDETIGDYFSRGAWQASTLADHWDRNASRNPEAIAVSDGQRRISWDEAKSWTDRIALGLIHLGLDRDDVLVVQLPNCVALPLIRVACEKAGVLCLPVPRTLRQSEIAYCLRYTEATAIVAPWRYRGFDYFAMLRELAPKMPRLRHILVAGEEVPTGAVGLEEMSRYPLADGGTSAELEKRRYKAGEVSLINATTGTTGLPKFAEYTAAARLLYGRSYIETLGLKEGDVLAALSPAPGGPNIPVYFAAPQLGARTVLLNHFDAEAAFRLIGQEQVTMACVGPAQLAIMVRHPSADRLDLSSVRFWLSVGAPLSPHLAHEAEEKLGGTILNCYGAVDWGGVVFTSPLDPPEVRYSTVGRPRAGTEVRLVDEAGKPIGAEGVGEIQGRGPSCSTGYYRDLEATRQAWTHDGWLRLGDLARRDGGGNLIIAGRKQDLIIRGGQNIAPVEIENYLLTHPNVKQAAVVGMPDPIMGERVCAYVVPRTKEPLTLEGIVLFLRSKKIAAYKLPERLELVDNLPMVSDTKVNKRALEGDIARKLRKGR